MKFTGILIEWEDMFPYTGKLAEALNGDAYSVTDVSFPRLLHWLYVI